MTLATIRTFAPPRSGLGMSLWRRVGRWLAFAAGAVLMAIGTVGAVLPGHLGVPILVLGLILILRSSMQARRRFIGLQHRHPKIVFPIRRLLRREPEVFPVAWQQLLRFEALLLPRSWRFAGRTRRRVFRKRRAT